MPSIIEALTTLASPLAPAAYIRQESKLQPTQLGYPATVPGLADWDKSIATSLMVRAAGVETDLDNAAGRYTWPFDDEAAAQIWPDKSAPERQRAQGDIMMLAVDATQRRVIADMIAKADKRAGLAYSEQAKLDYEQADAVLSTALSKITNALQRAQAGGGQSASMQTGSVAVGNEFVW